MAPNFFRVLLALVAVYAFLRGSRDERQVGVVLVVGVVATTLVLSPVAHRFSGLESSVMYVDIVVFFGFLWVALRSERFWPLWVAGLQLTTILGHLLKPIGVDDDVLGLEGQHAVREAKVMRTMSWRQLRFEGVTGGMKRLAEAIER